MLNGFNAIAPIYDWLAKLVFRKSIQASQKTFLNEIKDCSTILILGGGTGWLLKELLSVNRAGRIYYIDASSKMIELAKIAVTNDPRVNFTHGTEDSIPETVKFDAIVTNFYLDVFTNTTLETTVKKINQAALSECYWIATDFTPGVNWRQRMQLKLMYGFFKMFCKIESQQLPDWQQAIRKAGFKEQKSKTFCNGFILSVLFRLPH